VLGTNITHSSAQNFTWAAQFSEQFRAGVLYPRWTPDSFDGLGGPNFYFYSPLAFWIDSTVSAVTANLLPLSYRLAVSSVLILFASGLAMHAWLGAETERPRAALWGAVAYMAAPYHLLDHYVRGAFAEFTAYALLPLVLLGMRMIADHRRGGPIVVALAYAGLLTAHLPTALLASITVIAGYALFRLRGIAALVRCAAAGVLGLGLGSIYLLPSLALQDWISAEQWWTSIFQADRWFLLTPGRWPDPQTMEIVAPAALAAALIAAGLLLILLHLPRTNPRRSPLLFWIVVTFACLALMAGVVPWVWRIDLLAKVQFPWRLMLVVDFSIITAVCVAPLERLRRVEIYAFAAAAVALAPAVVQIAREAEARLAYTLQNGFPVSDLKSNEPKGFPHNPDTDYAETGLKPLLGLPAIDCAPPARTCAAEPGRRGEMRIRVDSDAPVSVTLRRFYYPNWRLDSVPAGPAPSIVPLDPYRLMSFTAPAGRAEFVLRRVVPSIELWGWAISGASLVLLLAWAGLAWRPRSGALARAQSTFR